jgi:LytR cell envelope-related transcriptional attenuator
MDHSTSLPRPHSWRTTAVVAAAVAVFELALLVLIGLAFVGRAVSEDASPVRALKAQTPEAAATKAPAQSQAPVPRLERSQTSVMVLNGNGRAGAAAETADLIRTRHYVIAGTGDAPRTDFSRSIVMFRPGYRAEAVRLARDFRIKRVAPLDGLKLTDLQGAHIALVVGSS